MADPLLHENAQVLCSHGAQARPTITQRRVRVGGKPVATINDQFAISGCPFIVLLKPQPCVRIQWVNPAVRVRVSGQPVLLSTTQSVCLSPESIPQGKAIPVQFQMRVRGV
jgi:hypothetical protein